MSSSPGSDRNPWWKNPAITIPAAATVLAAIVGGIVTAAVQPGNSSGSSTASGSARPTGPISPVPTSTVTSPGVAVLWRHAINLPYEYGVDIDSPTPNSASTSSTDIDFYTAVYQGNEPGFSFGTDTVGLAKMANPSYQQCQDAIETNAIDSAYTTQVGQTVCLKSGNAYPHVAAIQVMKWDSGSMDMVVNVTVWNR